MWKMRRIFFFILSTWRCAVCVICNNDNALCDFREVHVGLPKRSEKDL